MLPGRKYTEIIIMEMENERVVSCYRGSVNYNQRFHTVTLQHISDTLEVTGWVLVTSVSLKSQMVHCLRFHFWDKRKRKTFFPLLQYAQASVQEKLVVRIFT